MNLRVLISGLLASIGLPLQAQQDFGDLPEPAYPTLLSSNGPRHSLHQGVFLGNTAPDIEPDGNPSPVADGDNVTDTNDEDGFNATAFRPVRGFLQHMQVKATNSTASAATLSGFADWNADGDFNDAGETSSLAVPGGSAGTLFRLPWNVPLSAATTQAVAVRLRLATGGMLTPIGAANDGEVEDFFINVLAQGVDYGDLPDAAAGTASGAFGTGSPPDYRTRAADGGPSHLMKPGLYFTNDGPDPLAHLDAESDGQPNSNANGDDLIGEDDEYGLFTTITGQTMIYDGVHTEAEMSLTTSLAVTNTTGTDAKVYAFIDANSDGDFLDAGEQAAAILVPGDGSVTTVNPSFIYRVGNLTASPMSLTHALRFRITSDSGAVTATGAATDGEVHDELISYTITYTQPDPQTMMDYGDLNATRYPTLWASNGARHVISGQTLFIGSSVPDGEADAHASLTANGDDTHASDDEDGFVPTSVIPIAGSAISFPVKVSNVTGSPATLYGFVDWNDDGDFADAGESSSVGVPSGTANATVALPWNVPATASMTAPVAVRLRLTRDASVGPMGIAKDGEVEDYLISVIAGLDFGDLPAPYDTRSMNNGASHAVSSQLYLGNGGPDIETDGSPSPTATGDDTNGLDDEDAIAAASLTIVPGFKLDLPVTLTNSTGSNASLSGFIDWNGDGDFQDIGESAFLVVSSAAGAQSVNLEFNVPLAANTKKPLGARLRLADNALPSIGYGAEGEVEDFMVTALENALDFGDLPDGITGSAAGTHGTASPPDYQTRLADGGPSHVLRPGLYFAKDSLSTVEFAHVDPETDGQPSNSADGDDANNKDDEWAIFSQVITARVIPDGAHSEYEVELMVNHAVTNTTGTAAHLFGFIDVNSDGDFDDAGERAPAVPVPDGTLYASMNITFNFRVPLVGTPPTTFNLAVRSRITTDPTCGPNGAANDGEVQDDLISFAASWDPDDVRMDYGDLRSPRYPTLWADNGARHVIKPYIYLGTIPPDEDSDGHDSISANGDDTSGPNDEDGFNAAAVHPVAGSTFYFPITVTNNTGTSAEISCFVDWNNDGDFADAEERGTASAAGLPSSIAPTTITYFVPMNAPLTSSLSSPVAVRIRFSTETGLGPMGRAEDGEVEDYLITLHQADFGDLPAPYPTQLSQDGARHSPSDRLYLGSSSPDEDADGAPSTTASSDDSTASDDEDAIQPASVRAVRGFSFFMPVTVFNDQTATTTLTGLIDWNADGDFLDTGEISTKTVNRSASSQSVKLLWHVPPAASITGPVGARLRLSSSGPLPATGRSSDGEVEDFMITVMPQGIDYGDLPDAAPGYASGAFGTASPPDYKTRSSDGGPSHVMRPGLFFANDGFPLNELAHLDPESDAVPGITEPDGDDNDGEDDEYLSYSIITSQINTLDGTHSYADIEMVVSHAVTNTTGTNAKVFGFIDLNSDGDFNDPGEQAAPVPVPAGSATLGIAVPYSFRIPFTGTPPLNFNVAIRCRITTDPTCGPEGAASDGEVQDDLVAFTITWDPEDLRMDYGDHRSPRYPTLWADNGARHVIDPNLFLGTAAPDEDLDGYDTISATGDDLNGRDDEEGFIPSAGPAIRGIYYTYEVRVTNQTGKSAELSTFVDWNDDGDFADAGESDMIRVPTGVNDTVAPMRWLVPSFASTAAPVAVRVRFTTDPGMGPVGLASDGEVEDHLLTVQDGIDYGDLPDSVNGTAPGVVTDLSTISQGDYHTRIADNGPSHIMRRDLTLSGSGIDDIDHESDGIPSANADGDDLNGDDDEAEAYFAVMTQTLESSFPYNGTARLTFVLLGNVEMTNSTGRTAYLTAFADLNNDGDFGDVGEHGISDLNYDGDAIDPGESTIFAIPSAPGWTVRNVVFSRSITLTNQITSFNLKVPVRFRLSTASSLGPDGPAPDGEVEDYMVSLSFTTSQWWPNPNKDKLTTDYLFDIGTAGNLHSWHLPGNLGQASNIQWRIGNTPLSGPQPLINPSLLQTLGTGLIPYSASSSFGPQNVAGYAGLIQVGDLSSFRTFMGQSALNDENAAPNADADKDGRTNYEEFAFGTDPDGMNTQPNFQPKAIADGQGNKFFTVPYLRRTGGTSNGAQYSTGEVIYLPEASHDLTDWTKPVSDAPPPAGLPTPPSGYEWGAAKFAAPINGGGKGFIRLNAFSP